MSKCYNLFLTSLTKNKADSLGQSRTSVLGMTLAFKSSFIQLLIQAARLSGTTTTAHKGLMHLVRGPFGHHKGISRLRKESNGDLANPPPATDRLFALYLIIIENRTG